MEERSRRALVSLGLALFLSRQDRAEELKRLSAELTEIFSPGSFTAAVDLLPARLRGKRSARRLIGRLSTFPQRKIQPGTGPDFPERARIFLDGSNPS